MQLFKGNEAELLMNDASFIREWNALLSLCPWATVFQSPDFILPWYATFPNCQRILVCEFVGGIPTGILFLTQDQNGAISGAGTNLAEYQTWICRPENGSFPVVALEVVARHFPKKLIHLKFIPDGPFTLKQTRKIGSSSSLLLLQHLRPLMDNDVESLEKELKKKNRKEKINRLNRMGKLEYEKVEDLARFEEILPQLVRQNDLRKGAMYGKTAFIDEPERNLFLVALFKAGLLHASLLKVNEEIIASNVGILGDGKVYLQGLNTISPYYTKYSPGILHFLILGKHLASENIPEFDLTPGGTDGYKSMLATKSLPCFELFVGRTTHIRALKARQLIKDWLSKKGVSKSTTNYLSELSRFNTFLSNVEIKRPYQFYPLVAQSGHEEIKLKINHDQNTKKGQTDRYLLESGVTDDFFAIGKIMGTRKRQRFYQDCLKRMELGQEFFSVRTKDDYLALLWCWKPQESNISESEESGKLLCAYSFVQHLSLEERIAVASKAYFLKHSDNRPDCFLII